MQPRLTQEETKKLRQLSQQKNYDAIVALLDYRLAQALDSLTEISTDHRFVQGKYRALKDFRDDIVRQLK